jgi:hypothetical protein
MSEDTGQLRVATANVLRDITRAQAAAALASVLDHDPDLVGLQEWGLRRRGLVDAHPAWSWITPAYGENAVGFRASRYTLLGWRHAFLGGLALADRGVRSVPVLPPRTATTVRLHDRLAEREVVVVCYHLVPAVERHGAYRDDRPRLVRRHRTESRRLDGVVGRALARGAQVHAMGDSNFDAFAVAGLVSAWEGRRDLPVSTYGSAGRKIDDVFGPGPATDVQLVPSESDHVALVVSRAV